MADTLGRDIFWGLKRLQASGLQVDMNHVQWPRAPLAGKVKMGKRRKPGREY